MATQQQTLQQRLHYLGRVADATAPAEILETLKCYLAAWPVASIEALQTLDGGWGPFDTNLRPVPVPTLAHLRCIRDAVHAHCMALREAHVTPGAELGELEAFLFIAQYRAEALGVETSRRLTVVLPLAA